MACGQAEGRPSRCCRAPFYVRVDEADVVRLEWATGRERIEFVAGDEVVPRLRQTPDGACVFLAGDGRCTVYGARPAICESYPLGGHICPSTGPIVSIETDYTRSNPREVT